MPELPDVVVYVERLEALLVGRKVEAVELANPFVLRTVEPPLDSVVGLAPLAFTHIGKRIVWHFPDHLYLILHPMIAGRLRWKKRAAKVHRKQTHVIFRFDQGALVFTEAASKKKASIHMARGDDALTEHDRGGLDPLTIEIDAFRGALTRENHTLKRALTDQKFLAGIGNAYSDEILHAARLSPLQTTMRLDDDGWSRLHAATQSTLTTWIERTRAEVGGGFPDKVTAFRDGMAVHGRYREPCPVCSEPVQRICYAEKNDCFYCARCQTDGKLLSDRVLSKLFRGDRPKTLDEMKKRMDLC